MCTVQLKDVVLLAALVVGCATVSNVGPRAETEPRLVAGVPYDKGVAAFRKGDYPKALQYFDAAGSAGDGDALFFQGMMYGHRGCGVAQDNVKAVGLLQQAAAAHSAAAKFWLALSLAFGGGTFEGGKWYDLNQILNLRWNPPQTDILRRWLLSLVL